MNKEIEEKFVKTFVDKQMHDRLLFELFHKNLEKREHAISRFEHGAVKYLKRNYIHLADNKITIDVVEKEIRKIQPSTNECYIIGTTYDGKKMQFKKALEITFDWLGGAILIISDNVAFIKKEQSYGAPMKYILYKS